jgi:basic membrane protein A
MAIVYKAYDTRLEREVAIKLIRRNAFSPDVLERVLKRFDREAKSLAKLTHPNIVSIIDYGDYEGSPYLVMPYLQGGTLKEMLGQPMPYQKAAALLAPIADALGYAHQKGIVHRDVKPGNILVTEGGLPMLTDFGIARLLENEETQTLTGTGVGVGTPEYMSPEQGLGREVDGRTDIYSLGVVLYEIVTGRKPYSADTPMAVVLKQSTEPLPRPSAFVHDLPEKVEKLLFKALAKRPEDRYQSMGEFDIALCGLNELQVIPTIQPRNMANESLNKVGDTHFTMEHIEHLQTFNNLVDPQDNVNSITHPVKYGNEKENGRNPKKNLNAWPFLVIGLGILVVGLFAILLKGRMRQPATAISHQTPIQSIQSLTAAVDANEMAPQLTSEPNTEKRKIIICEVTDLYGINDNSFNANVWRGVENSITQLGVEGYYLEPGSDSEFMNHINAFIDENCDLIVSVGWMAEDSIKIAAQANPYVKFSIIDRSYDPILPNVVGQEFQTDEAAFLAGYLAAGMTQTGKVATFGGLPIPTVTIFMDGFSRGVKYYNSVKGTAVEVLGWNTETLEGTMAMTFDDLQKGKELGISFLNEGADIIFPVAGFIGLGTAAAVKERGNAWVIGVDADWTINYPEFSAVTLTSIMKNSDVSTMDVIKSVVDGTFVGGTYVGTLANKGVGLGVINLNVPHGLLMEIEELEDNIINGIIQFNNEFKK